MLIAQNRKKITHFPDTKISAVGIDGRVVGQKGTKIDSCATRNSCAEIARYDEWVVVQSCPTVPRHSTCNTFNNVSW